MSECHVSGLLCDGFGLADLDRGLGGGIGFELVGRVVELGRCELLGCIKILLLPGAESWERIDSRS